MTPSGSSGSSGSAARHAPPTTPGQAAPSGSGDQSSSRLQGLVLIALGIWIFSPALRGDWLWDDYKYILHNPLTQDPAGLWNVLTRPDAMGDYDPLTSAVRWLQWQCWGDDTLGYHLTNLGLHLACAFLLWRLFHLLRIPCAWFGALIFTAHPLMVESVAWIAELKNTLSLPPLLLAMLSFLAYDQGGRRADYARSIGWFAVSLLAKASGMMLPVILLGYAWWKRGTISRAEIKAAAPFLVLAAAAGCVSVASHAAASASAEVVATGGWAARLASLGWAALFLLGKALAPVGLMPAYPGNAVETPGPVDLLPWLLSAGGIGLLWSQRMGWGRPVLAGLGFFLVNLVPVFGFIAMNYATMVWSMDHLLYLPMIGLIGLFAAAAGVATKRLSPALRPLATVAGFLVVAFLAIASHTYAATFSDEEALWRHALIKSPGFAMARENLGKALLVRDRAEEARPLFEELVRMNPRRAASHADLAKALVQSGRVEDGIAQYRQALSLDPSDAEVQNNMGTALMQAGAMAEAVAHLTEAVRLKPDYALAYDNLGVALAATGRNEEALDRFAQALKLTPGSARTHDNMGYALLKLGRNEEAGRQFGLALKIDPQDPRAREGMAKSEGTK